MTEPLLNHPERWPADLVARNNFPACIFLARVLHRLSKDQTWDGLRSGELIVRVLCEEHSNLDPISVPSPTIFLNADRDYVLAECKIDVLDLDQCRPSSVRRRIPVPHWLFVTRESLEKFIKGMPAATNGAESRAIERLAALLRQNDMPRAEAAKICEPLGIKGRGFLTRVWPRARENAGLPRVARSGPKSKQNLKR
jgi:hypothetical protein